MSIQKSKKEACTKYVPYCGNNPQRKPTGESGIENPEILATLDKYGTMRRPIHKERKEPQHNTGYYKYKQLGPQ